MFTRLPRSRPRRPGRAALSLLAAFATVAALLFGVGAPQAAAASSLPCDIYAAAGTPCVAAHSLVRALYSSYGGSLYQVQRASDGATANIGLLTAGGYADAAAQDTFCSGTTCIITKIYDQSSRHNDLTVEGAGGAGAADVGAPPGAGPGAARGAPGGGRGMYARWG
ncbi:arabinofuranosidase catalytic domain-containing protein, partial [Streptomyces sp. NPDC058964]|uniref:arabinofuranosidase catalytic domain-containing protein n=1 Tax=Streptomyces sp. NPDC058964 TaxID=3346681 RepID=UPI00369607AF